MKKVLLILVILSIFIFGKIDLVKADGPYEVTLNGIIYVCESKGETFGSGWAKNHFASAEEAKKYCTEQQENYFDRQNIYIFDDPTTCVFRETPELYDCDCHTTTYRNCKQKDDSQKPTYTKPTVINVTFFDENNKVYDTRSCESANDKTCNVTAPSYRCSNGYSFNGWASSSPNCSVPTIHITQGGSTLYLSAYSSNGYYTYYACCGYKVAPTITPKIVNTPIITTPVTPNPTTTPDNTPTDENNQENPENPSSTIEPINQEQNESTISKNGPSITILLIIMGILFISLIVVIILYRNYKNKSYESDE